MSPEEQRITIAELWGWIMEEETNWHPNGDAYSKFYNPFEGIPDYPKDLNAMREVISSLNHEQRKAMRAIVWELSDQMDPLPEASVYAEAFLILKGCGKAEERLKA